jgi:hypothetical protein
MQAQQMLLLARKYAHIYAHIYASGIKPLMVVFVGKVSQNGLERLSLISKPYFKESCT